MSYPAVRSSSLTDSQPPVFTAKPMGYCAFRLHLQPAALPTAAWGGWVGRVVVAPGQGLEGERSVPVWQAVLFHIENCLLSPCLLWVPTKCSYHCSSVRRKLHGPHLSPLLRFLSCAAWPSQQPEPLAGSLPLVDVQLTKEAGLLWEGNYISIPALTRHFPVLINLASASSTSPPLGTLYFYSWLEMQA